MVTSETTLAERNKRSTKQLFVWTLGWLVTLATVAFGPKLIWDFEQTYTLIAILVNLFFGYKMILANKHHLDGCDELQRRIYFNAMAISLGVSLVVGAVLGVVEAVRLVSFTPNPSNLLFVMGISYFVSIFVGFRKYQ